MDEKTTEQVAAEPTTYIGLDNILAEYTKQVIKPNLENLTHEIDIDNYITYEDVDTKTGKFANILQNAITQNLKGLRVYVKLHRKDTSKGIDVNISSSQTLHFSSKFNGEIAAGIPLSESNLFTEAIILQYFKKTATINGKSKSAGLLELTTASGSTPSTDLVIYDIKGIM